MSTQTQNIVVNKAPQACFYVEKMLGRPFKKYNIIIVSKEGQYFSSDDMFINLLSYLKVSGDEEWIVEYVKYCLRTCKDNSDKTCYGVFNIGEVEKNKFGTLEHTYYMWRELN